MTWKSKRKSGLWRKFLTVDEEAILRRADEAKAHWAALNRDRARITNRAIHRAKYSAGKAIG
jgi:hypothetical protein